MPEYHNKRLRELLTNIGGIYADDLSKLPILPIDQLAVIDLSRTSTHNEITLMGSIALEMYAAGRDYGISLYRGKS